VDFALDEEQQILQRTLRSFAEKRVAAEAALRDRQGLFPTALLQECAALGLTGMLIPEQYGGSAMGAVAYSLALTEIGRACAGTAVTLSVSNMVAEAILRWGSESQRQEYLPGLCDGALVPGAFALTEPECGSDPAGLRTRATRVPEGYRLSGEKVFCTSASHAGVFLLVARTGAAGGKGLSAFLIPRGQPGLTVTRVEEKLGQHASDTATVCLDDCLVDAGALLGPEGAGLAIALGALDGGRIGIGSLALGIGQAALLAAGRYALQRVQFGKPIAEHGAIQAKLADCATELEAAQLLVWRAAWLKERGGARPTGEAAMAKLFATEAASHACDEALQIHGGYGYSKDFPVERYYRDVRVTRLYEGTSEIQRLVIARKLLERVGEGQGVP
jgi:alkylation response protein AidB-like acyl-CoA dehydrogenase